MSIVTTVVWFALFGGLALGIVGLWRRLLHNIRPIILGSIVGGIFGLSLYMVFSLSLEHPIRLVWQGLSWIIIGMLCALTTLTVWRQTRD